MKGITPVIALVMLMLITVGMVGMAYTWFSGMLTSYTEKSISVPPGGAFCSNSKLNVVIMNTGTTSSITQADLVLVDIDGTLIALPSPAADPRPSFTANPGEGKIAVANYGCSPSPCSVGAHAIRIGTRAGIVETSAICK